MVSVTGSGGTDFLSLSLHTVIEPMPSRRHPAPDLLQQSYATHKKPIQDLLPALDELLQNPLDPDGKPRHIYGRDLRDKLKKWIDELQGVQSELEDVLDRDLADTENKEERVLKTERKEVIISHGEFFQGLLRPKLGELDVLIEEIQEAMDEEKAVSERKRIRTQELEEAENRARERREERKREMAIQLSAQKRAMDLAKLTHSVAAETLPTSSFKCKSGRSVKPPKLQLKSFFGDHLSWHEFWDSFSTSIHNNTQLSIIDKFLYLKGLIRGDAEKVIAGFSLTEMHYKQAIHALQERFEDTADSMDDVPSEISEVGGRSDDVGFGTDMMMVNVEGREEELEESERTRESHRESETESGVSVETESDGGLVENVVGEEKMSPVSRTVSPTKSEHEDTGSWKCQLFAYKSFVNEVRRHRLDFEWDDERTKELEELKTEGKGRVYQLARTFSDFAKENEGFLKQSRDQ